jgi:uncharacterized membrane protein
MHFFGKVGLLLSSSGIFILLYLLVQKIKGMDIGDRPLLFLGILLLTLGFHVIFSGIVIDYLMRTYFESQRKKPYDLKSIQFEQKENQKGISVLV